MRTGEESERAASAYKTSEILKSLLAEISTPRVSLGVLVAALEERAFGVLLLIFALPNLVPIAVPGLSAVLGLPLVVLSAQFVVGRSVPWFPSWLSRRSLRTRDLARVLDYSAPHLKRFEKVLRPRFLLLTSRYGELVIGWVCLILSILIVLPIPLGNWIPALAIAVLGLALVERDGVAALAGFVVGAVGLGLVLSVIGAIVEFAREALDYLTG